MPRLLPSLLALALCAPLAVSLPALAQDKSYEIDQSAIDSNVHDFTSPNLVLPNTTVHGAPLVVFLTGAGVKPTSAHDFLKFVAGQGYPVIALEYDNEPTVAQTCPQNPDPDCAEALRRSRVGGIADGPGASPIATPPLETVTARLIILLRFLTQDKPGEGWDYYLDGDNVRWDRVAIAGVDEGAGMAAYIAKHHKVARVVLLSSPRDIGPDRQAAPWLALPPATPADRWFGEYQAQNASQNLYTTLNIPADHIRMSADARDTNPASLIRDRRYALDWAALFGKASPLGTQ